MARRHRRSWLVSLLLGALLVAVAARAVGHGVGAWVGVTLLAAYCVVTVVVIRAGDRRS